MIIVAVGGGGREITNNSINFGVEQTIRGGFGIRTRVWARL